ncbi:MAG: phosphotransferase enzyme family protein [Chloroflexota bacterium]
MREPPTNLSDEILRASLRADYGIAAADLAFLSLGHDSSAWVYRARTADDTSYFLKVRTRVVNEPGLLVPRYLHDHGIARVAAPLPTTAGTPWTRVADYVLILYPFIAGTTGMERGLSDRQWIDYGALLRQIHAAALPPDLARVPARESFVPGGAGAVRKLDAHIADQEFDDPAARALAAFWRARRADIRTLLNGAEDLGRRLAQTKPPLVLCHADIHTANVLVDTEGQVWIVDWDETILAPCERDLMFVVGGIIGGLVGPRREELFFQGYGAATVDPLALAYYRYAWAVGDIGAFGEEVFFRPDLGPITRQAAVELFMSLFMPGNIVELAFAWDGRTI